MVSEKKLQANRLNAQKSTGPKTPEGKARSAQNGLTHGLFSRKCPILPGESKEEFDALHNALIADLRPRGVMQHELVMDLADVRWRIRRLPQIEFELMLREQIEIQKKYEDKVSENKLYRVKTPVDEPDFDPVKILATKFAWDEKTYERIDLYRQRMSRQMHTILRELRRLREETGAEDEVGWAPPTIETVGDAHPTEDQPGKEASGKSEPTVEPKELSEQKITHINCHPEGTPEGSGSEPGPSRSTTQRV
jgi:hypothetical protein